ncbi:hypothetical protein ACQUW6_32105 [Bacillus thuringiensis]|uniref:hypothetical protein n=1 Tax=Bacillus thuringiensis TaxID=1428 RepID=UPI003D0AE7E6
MIHDLGTLGTGFNSLANDINDSRRIVGTSETGNGNIEAFVRQTNTNSPLVSLAGGSNSTAAAITISGTTTYVVRQSETATGSAHAVVWKAPSGTTFGLPTDLGVEVICMFSSNTGSISDLGLYPGDVWDPLGLADSF